MIKIARLQKEWLFLMDDPGDENALTMTAEEFMNAESIKLSYHQLSNPRAHMCIAGSEYKRLLVVPTSEADIQYAEEILSRCEEVTVIGDEDELRQYMDTYIKFVPELSGEIRKAYLMKKSIGALL